MSCHFHRKEKSEMTSCKPNMATLIHLPVPVGRDMCVQSCVQFYGLQEVSMDPTLVEMYQRSTIGHFSVEAAYRPTEHQPVLPDRKHQPPPRLRRFQFSSLHS